MSSSKSSMDTYSVEASANDMISEDKPAASSSPTRFSHAVSDTKRRACDMDARNVRRKLDLTSLRNFGRNSELQILKRHYDMAVQEGTPSLVLIEAASGEGKTALLDIFVRDYIISKNGAAKNCCHEKSAEVWVCRGKFEERTAASEPFDAFKVATKPLFERMVVEDKYNASVARMNKTSDCCCSNNTNPVKSSWRERIQDAVDLDMELMEEILPEMKCLFADENYEEDGREDQSPATSSMEGPSVDYGTETPRRFSRVEDRSSSASSIDFEAFGDMSDKEFRFERFRLAFRSLIRCISTFSPLVFILDDMHWANPDCVRLITTLLEDISGSRISFDESMIPCASSSALDPINAKGRSNKQHLLLVGSTRPIKEYKCMNPLIEAGAIIERKNFNVITLKPLTVDEVSSMLADILELSGENRDESSELCADICSLAKVIHVKTAGNTFVMLQFLRLLEEKSLIYFSENESRWLWDGYRINEESEITDNVTQVIAKKLCALNNQIRNALMTAASFGVSHFEVSTIVHAMTVLEEATTDNSQRHDINLDGSEKAGDPSAQSLDLSFGIGTSDIDHAVCGSSIDFDSPLARSVDPYLVLEKSKALKQLLRAAAHDGLVEEVAPGTFCFAHDRIREAAYSLLPNGHARKEMHLKIGRQLRYWMDEQQELGVMTTSLSQEAMLLHATRQLNLGADLIEDVWEKLDLADLNYQAAELAAKKASFYPSMEYLQSGLLHLSSSNAWDDHYSLTLKLKVALTRMQYSCGLFADCIKSAGCVLSHAKRFADKKPVLHTMVFCLLQQEKQKEATVLLLDILKSLGEPFPKRCLMLHALWGFFKSKRLLKNLSDDDILNLDKAKDKDHKIKHSAPFMERLAELSFLGGDSAYILLFTFRLTQILVRRGNFALSGYGLGVWGWLRSQMGSFDDGMRYGQLSLQLFHKGGEVPKESVRMKLLYWFFIAHWRLPLHDALEPIDASLRQLWVLGALDYYHLGTYSLSRTQFACGVPLDKILQECKKHSESLLDFKHMLVWNISAPLHQAVLNFMGKSNDPRILIGERMNCNVCCKEWQKTGNKMALFQNQLFGMIVAYYFKDNTLAEKHVSEMRQALYEDGPDVLVPLRLFYSSLVYLARFRESRKWKYKRNALSMMRQIQKWVDGGAVNCFHMNLLLQAELLSCNASSSKSSILEAYTAAVSAASDSGMMHHNALANELAGNYLWNHHCSPSQKYSVGNYPGDADEGRQTEDAASVQAFIRKAVDLYSRWGAHAKVDEIRSCFSVLLPQH